MWPKPLVGRIVFLLVGLLTAAHAQKRFPGAQIIVATTTRTQSIAGPLVIEISLTNSSTHEIWISENNPDLEYQLTALDQQDRELPLTAYGKWIRDPGGFPLDRNFMQQLKPGESAQGVRFDLHKFFVVTQPGQYRVFVRRLIYHERREGAAKAMVHSNELAIDVTS